MDRITVDASREVDPTLAHRTSTNRPLCGMTAVGQGAAALMRVKQILIIPDGHPELG